jgi:hypothetical protein
MAVKRGVLLSGKSINLKGVNTKFLGKYLDLREVK